MTNSLKQPNGRAVLAPHIAYIEGLKAKVRFNLSNSCAQSMTVAELCRLGETSLEHLSLGYASLRGDPQLRQAIVAFHHQLNAQHTGEKCHLSAEHVLNFCGAQEALAAIYHSVLSAGDEVVVFTPNYPSLVTMAQGLGARVIALPLTQANGWQMDIDRLKAAVNHKTRLIVINSPQNPTGSMITTEQAREVLAIAQQYGCFLLADDVAQASNYNDLALAHDYLSYENSIVVSVMSKSLGLAGLRIGWALSPNRALVEQMLALKTFGSICCSAMDEQLALLALTHRQTILNHNNQIIRDNIAHFSRFVLNNSPGFSWCPPQAGIMTLVHAQLAVPVATWSKQLVQQTGLLVLPSDLFGLEGEYFRLGLGQRGFADALAEFQGFLDANHLLL